MLSIDVNELVYYLLTKYVFIGISPRQVDIYGFCSISYVNITFNDTYHKSVMAEICLINYSLFVKG